MNSALPKVLHPVCGQPMLGWVLDACTEAGIERLIVVVGHGKDEVQASFADRGDLVWVEQAEQRGTGHAAMMCEQALAGFDGQTFVIAGDMPLIRGDTLSDLGKANADAGEGVTLATSILDDATGYGRIVRDSAGQLNRIVEQNDCSETELGIKEVNISYYCFDNRRLFEALQQLRPDNAKGEYYITDAVRIMLESGHGAGAVAAVPQEDALGVNSRIDLALVNGMMAKRIRRDWMLRGVTIAAPSSTWIECHCRFGSDVTVMPFSFVGRGADVGDGCRIGPFGYISEDEVVSAGSVIGPASALGAMR